MTNAGSYISLQGCHRDKGKIERKKNCQEFDKEKKMKIIIFNKIIRVFVPQADILSLIKLLKAFSWYEGNKSAIKHHFDHF